MPHALRILYEDNHLLAVLKPAGLATMGVAADSPSLWKLAKEYLKRKYHKPGNVYLGVVSRLDSPVSGVVLFARTSKAAARLTEQFRVASGRKNLLGAGGRSRGTRRRARSRIISPAMKPTTGCESSAPRCRAPASHAQLPPAENREKNLSLLEVELHTGRKHQIRLQLAEVGHPIVGDRKYGSRRKFAEGIALHARRLTVKHPVRDESMTFEAPLPESLGTIWSA